MRKIYMIVLIASFLWECDDNYFHDTGLANGVHDCTMWEYLRSDHENWDSTVLLIERAGLVPLPEIGCITGLPTSRQRPANVS